MVNVDVHVRIMHSKFYRIYFILWYLFSVVLLLNIMVAFIIDYLVSKWGTNVNEDEDDSSQ